MITVAALSPSLDITYLVDRLRLGAIHRPTEVHRVAGGKPLNLARAATTVGATVRTVAVLGGATGDFIARELAAAGIGVRAVDSPAETRTCVSIASADRDDLTEIYQYAPAIAPQLWDDYRSALRAELQPAVETSSSADSGVTRGGWLAINGSAPQGLPGTAFAELVDIGRSAGLRVAVDTHGPALAAVLDSGPQLIKINRYEAAELVGQDPDEADIPKLITIISDRTGGDVIITDGRAGAVGGTAAGERFRVTMPDDVAGRYPVGSGDSFLGGWLAAVENAAAPVDALRLATGCGAANALVPGAGTLQRTTAEQIADRVRVSRLD